MSLLVQTLFHKRFALYCRFFSVFVSLICRVHIFTAVGMFVSSIKKAKRELGQYPGILTELAWSIKRLLHGIRNTEKLRTCLFQASVHQSIPAAPCVFLNVVMFSSNVLFEEFVLRSLRISPLTKPFFGPGG